MSRKRNMRSSRHPSRGKSVSRKKPSHQALGMATFLWGPLFWALSHDVAIIMDRRWSEWDAQQRHQSAQYWFLLQFLLPCRYCRESYTQFYRQDPPTYPFTVWVFNLHNKVNQKLEKPLLEWDKFQRKAQVYQSFSNITTLWDIFFIMAINYEPKQKQKPMREWFGWLVFMMPWLVRDRMFDPDAIILTSPGSVASDRTILRSQASFLQHLARMYNQTFSTRHSVDYFVTRFGPAISHNTPEELALICGALIRQCNRTTAA
jgi:hypothetical protein